MYVSLREKEKIGKERKKKKIEAIRIKFLSKTRSVSERGEYMSLVGNSEGG